MQWVKHLHVLHFNLPSLLLLTKSLTPRMRVNKWNTSPIPTLLSISSSRFLTLRILLQLLFTRKNYRGTVHFPYVFPHTDVADNLQILKNKSQSVTKLNTTVLTKTLIACLKIPNHNSPGKSNCQHSEATREIISTFIKYFY